MERLESYVASKLLQRLRRTAGDDRAGACISFRGATLFVDISNYTGLAESLCSNGSTGVEQLGDILDRVFRSHVSAVHQSGGEIAYFAGDAFLAYWAADDNDLACALRRAEDCARLLHLTPWLEPHTAPQAPLLHIGAGAGDLWGARLGVGPGWHVLLAGAAVRQACAASRRAAAGETVVAPDRESVCARSFAESIAGQTAAGGVLPNRVISPGGSPMLDPLEIAAHVPKRVQEFAGEGYAAWIPQRRTMSALFVRIDGLDETSPDALARYQAVVTSIGVALRPYARSSGQLRLDDKGLVFTLCLGVPDDAHADDALRAVRAGLAIGGELSRLGVGCAMGVAAGDGVCMPIGGHQRRLYWTGGRFKHVGARLIEAAGSGLLCTEPVADRVRHAVSLSPERPLTLKGVRWPVRVFRAHEPGFIDDQGGVLYGRREEQSVLDDCLRTLEGGRGTVLWMAGDAGLGKTALVEYLLRTAAQRAIPCLKGGAGSVEMSVAYASWRPVFSSLFEPTMSQAERRERLEAIRHPEFASLLNAVIPGFLAEPPLVQSLSGQSRADATLGVLSDVLALHSDGRFVLVLEDCHWMDSASWRLAVRVAQDHPAALIVLTSRPTTDVQELGALRRLERYREMNLPPLGSAAIGSLVETVLQGWRAPAELVDEITDRSMGNPLFAREYALLLASGVIQGHAGAPAQAAKPSEDATVPNTIESLIASRLDALPPAEDLALKAASVIGDTFTVETIHGVYPGGPATDGDLETLLRNLAARQLIVRLERGSAGYAFSHALIREVTYRQLTREQRRELHRRCAERIEARNRSDLTPHVAALAHHWANAEVAAFTIRYTEQAGSQALSAGAFAEAERLLGSCLEHAQRGTQPIESADLLRWYRQLADARRGMGYLARRKEAAHLALAVAGISRPRTTFLQVSLSAVRLGELCARWLFSAGPALPAEQTLDVARAFRHSGEVCYFENDRFGMLSDTLSAVAYAARLGPSAVLVGALTEFGGIVSVGGLRRTGERLLQWAIEMAENADDQAAQAYGHMINCLYYIGQGDWQAAETSCRLCQDLCEPVDDRVNWTNAQAVRFWMSHYRGRVGAEDAARNLLNRAMETGNLQHRGWALRCLAVCALRSEQFEEAIAHLAAAQESLKETAALNERVPTFGLLSLARWRIEPSWPLSEVEDALVLLDKLKQPMGHGSLEGYSALATVALEAWEASRSMNVKNVGADRKGASQKCLAVLERYSKSFPIGEPRCAMHWGDYWRIAGHPRKARGHYERGEAAALRLGMPWEATRCREQLERLRSPSR